MTKPQAPSTEIIPAVDTRGLSTAHLMLFAAARAGHVELPKSVVEALRILAAAESVEPPERPDLFAVRAAYGETVTAALRAGKAVPGPTAVEAALVADRAADEQATAIEAAHTALRGDVAHALAAVDVVVDIVRPAVQKLEAEAADLTARHGTALLLDAEQVVAEAPAIAALWRQYGDLVQAHAELRRLHRQLTDSGCVRDDGTFATWRDDPRQAVVWGPRWPGKNLPGAATPWPVEARAWLHWLTTSGVQPWVPTSGERDQRWIECFPDRPLVNVVGGYARIPLDGTTALV